MAIFVSKNLKFKLVLKVCVVEICESLFTEVFIGDLKFLFGVVYLPNGNLSAFEDRHRDILSKYTDIIIVGDFNCNMFNISKSNAMRSLCTRLNLSISHNSKPTHLDIACNSTSLLDYFLVSDMSAICFSGQAQCSSISDHALIFA